MELIAKGKFYRDLAKFGNKELAIEVKKTLKHIQLAKSVMKNKIKPKFQYVIRIDHKEVWKGLNPKEKYRELKKNNPDKRVSIAWQTNDDSLMI